MSEFISGTLKVISPLQIAAGLPQERDICIATSNTKFKRQPIGQVSVVTRAYDGRFYIPGSTLKGALVRHANNKQIGGGSHDADSVNFGQGKVRFEDAFERRNDKLNTGTLEASVVIDRETGTAQESLLYYNEYVPVGTIFDVRFRLRGTDEKQNKQLGHELLAILNLFDGTEQGIKLGKSKNNGKGRLKWVPSAESVTKFGGSNMVVKLDERVWINAEIEFTGGFRVNDPLFDPNFHPENTEFVQAFLKDSNGKATLPSKSVRGAMRNQSERILRTMGHQVCTVNNRCNTPTVVSQIKQNPPCMACLTFGGINWAAPLEFHISNIGASEIAHVQKHVAIDRFTGGGVDGKLYSEQKAFNSKYKLTLGVDTRRIDKALGAEGRQSILALLALLFRDWAEGDMPIGGGTTRGNGDNRLQTNWRSQFEDFTIDVSTGLNLLRIAPKTQGEAV